MKIKGANLTAIFVALIIGLSIFGYGLLNFIQKENQLKFEEKQKTEKYYTQTQLDNCLKETQKEFDSLSELNSYSDPTKDNPGRRKWDSWAVAESTQAQLEKSKELCAKLYGPK